MDNVLKYLRGNGFALGKIRESHDDVQKHMSNFIRRMHLIDFVYKLIKKA
jgi:hypothetical protein